MINNDVASPAKNCPPGLYYYFSGYRSIILTYAISSKKHNKINNDFQYHEYRITNTIYLANVWPCSSGTRELQSTIESISDFVIEADEVF